MNSLGKNILYIYVIKRYISNKFLNNCIKIYSIFGLFCVLIIIMNGNSNCKKILLCKSLIVRRHLDIF